MAKFGEYGKKLNSETMDFVNASSK